MNILFYLPLKPVPETGGVQRVTTTLASALANGYGHTCFAAYKYDAPGELARCFGDVRRVSMRDTASDVVRLVSEWGVDVVVVQGVRPICRQIRCAGLPPNVWQVYVQHSEPGGELKAGGKWLGQFARDVSSGQNTSVLAKDIGHIFLWPKYWFDSKRRLRMEYREAYDFADHIVVLAPGYVSQYEQLAGIAHSQKLRAISNPPSFDCLVSEDVLSSKEKIVLVVARLDERYKRISLALSAWRDLQGTGIYSDWALHIVGDGPDSRYYRLKVEREGIPGVRFLGQMDPREEYQKASLFLMTSVSEGCPLTLTEAQQFGVVPVAISSFAAISDLVDNGESGVLIGEGDATGFTEALGKLMSDESERMRLAKGCLRESQGRSAAAVAEAWNKLLVGLTHDDLREV